MNHVMSLFVSLSFLGVPAGFANYLNVVERSPHYQSVIQEDYIRISGGGRLSVSYEAVRMMLKQDDILDVVQEAYAAQLEDGQKPEFEVKSRGHRHWGYVNKSGQASEIIELYRHIEPGQPAQLILFTRGERFFGDFKAIVKVFVHPVAEGELDYELQVYAYPENSVSRFFARHLGIAEHFFRAKTTELTNLVVKICQSLVSGDVTSRT